MSRALRSEAVVGVLDHLCAVAEIRDEPAKQRIRTREQELQRKVYGHERAELYGDASLAITRQVGELLYVLCAARRPRVVVEFGASLGFSTIHLAAALRDLGSGSLISTESQPQKAAQARKNLRDAGLADLVDLRVGDALQTLRGSPGHIDLLFLDGWNDLYLQLLELLQPRLTGAALVVADMSADDPHLRHYQEYVRAPENGYLSISVPFDDGVEISLRRS